MINSKEPDQPQELTSNHPRGNQKSSSHQRPLGGLFKMFFNPINLHFLIFPSPFSSSFSVLLKFPFLLPLFSLPSFSFISLSSIFCPFDPPFPSSSSQLWPSEKAFGQMTHFKESIFRALWRSTGHIHLTRISFFLFF